jgi:hypothetical protein
MLGFGNPCLRILSWARNEDPIILPDQVYTSARYLDLSEEVVIINVYEYKENLIELSTSKWKLINEEGLRCKFVQDFSLLPYFTRDLNLIINEYLSDEIKSKNCNELPPLVEAFEKSWREHYIMEEFDEQTGELRNIPPSLVLTKWPDNFDCGHHGAVTAITAKSQSDLRKDLASFGFLNGKSFLVTLTSLGNQSEKKPLQHTLCLCPSPHFNFSPWHNRHIDSPGREASVELILDYFLNERHRLQLSTETIFALTEPWTWRCNVNPLILTHREGRRSWTIFFDHHSLQWKVTSDDSIEAR